MSIEIVNLLCLRGIYHRPIPLSIHSISLLSKSLADNYCNLLSDLLTTERLKSFSDSVLLVAITILAYNLVPPSVVNGQVNPDELKDFYYNLYGLISSFIVISIFWIFSMYFFDYLKYPNEIITLTSITFFVLILVTPIATVGELQYRNWEAVTALSLLQIFNSMMMIFLWWYLGKNKNLQSKEKF